MQESGEGAGAGHDAVLCGRSLLRLQLAGAGCQHSRGTKLLALLFRHFVLFLAEK